MQQALSAGAAWMNGTIIPISEASIPVTDWGLTHSDITYDVAPVRDGAFFRLNDFIIVPQPAQQPHNIISHIMSSAIWARL